MTKKTANPKGRAKVKNLRPQAEQSLTAKEAKKVKGGIIIINNRPPDHNLIQGTVGNPGGLGTVGHKVKK